MDTGRTVSPEAIDYSVARDPALVAAHQPLAHARQAKVNAHRWLEPALAFVVVASIGFDRMIVVWTAGAPWISMPFQSIVVSPSVGAFAVLAVYGVLSRPSAKPEAGPAGGGLFLVSAGTLLACTVASAVVAIAPILSFARAIEIGVGILGCWTIARRPRLARWLVVSLCALILVQLPFVILQEATQSTYPYATIVQGLPQETSASSPGANVVFALDGARWQRASGTLAHPNVLGGLLAIALVLSVVWFGRRGRHAWLLLPIWLIGWLELGLSFSRAALLAALLGLGAYVVSQRHWRRTRRNLVIVFGAMIVAFGAAIAIAGPVFVRWMALRPSLLGGQSAIQRGLIDGVALEIIRAHPLLGVGAGNFSLSLLAPPFNAVTVDPAHALPILIAAESGALAGAAWLVMVLAIPFAALLRHRDICRFGLQGAIILVLLTLSLLDHYLWTLTSGRAIFWTVLGIAAAFDRHLEVSR